MKKTTIKDCKLIKLPVITSSDRKGSITPIYNNIHIPFGIQRVYYLYDVPSGSERGGHGHKELQQLIVAASGSFDVVICDGKNEKIIHLNRPSSGIYLPQMVWRELKNFSGGGICLVLASLPYDENDYYYDYKKFAETKWQK